MDNKFEGKFSISSTYSNKTNNTNESNALIKEKNITVMENWSASIVKYIYSV